MKKKLSINDWILIQEYLLTFDDYKDGEKLNHDLIINLAKKSDELLLTRLLKNELAKNLIKYNKRTQLIIINLSEFARFMSSDLDYKPRTGITNKLSLIFIIFVIGTILGFIAFLLDILIEKYPFLEFLYYI